MSAPSAYPLAWPGHVPRHQGPRHVAKFTRKVRMPSSTPGSLGYETQRRLTVADAIERLQAELVRFGATHLVVSTNVPVRRDGLPYSDRSEPADPGAAIYFHLRKRPYCLPCDRWTRVADNVAAVAAHVEALRGIERWGVGTVEQAFTGYLALPGPEVDWRAEFPQVQTVAELDAAYRARAKALHPDHGGSADAMARLNLARDAARCELEGQ